MKHVRIHSIAAESDAAPCACCAMPDPGRRAALKAAAGAALAVGVGMRPAWAADDGPRKGDWLVPVDEDGAAPAGEGSEA